LFAYFLNHKQNIDNEHTLYPKMIVKRSLSCSWAEVVIIWFALQILVSTA